jgi:hypothetical protein
MKQKTLWRKLRQEVSAVVRTMPLWKLQNVGRDSLDFLYENAGTGERLNSVRA